jgi:hypothetical protein
VPKCIERKPGCWWRVVETSFRTAAPGLEGSPIEVSGVRGMRAISVVGILRFGGGGFGLVLVMVKVVRLLDGVVGGSGVVSGIGDSGVERWKNRSRAVI